MVYTLLVILEEVEKNVCPKSITLTIAEYDGM